MSLHFSLWFMAVTETGVVEVRCRPRFLVWGVLDCELEEEATGTLIWTDWFAVRVAEVVQLVEGFETLIVALLSPTTLMKVWCGVWSPRLSRNMSQKSRPVVPMVAVSCAEAYGHAISSKRIGKHWKDDSLIVCIFL